jgi:hypothetical protein
VNPRTYQVTVHVPGFAAASSEPTPAEVGRNVALNFSLHPASSSQTVEITAQQGLLSLDNPNTTTTLDATEIKNLPNPGQDLTYLAQFAQGALMNTAGSSSDAKPPGGYGNLEFNGLPATSKGYILDGYDSNDPWLGLNIGLSTNLVIGSDAAREAAVNTNSFSVDQGRYGASQVNYITKAGTNAFHGDVWEMTTVRFSTRKLFFYTPTTRPATLPRSCVTSSINSAAAWEGQFAKTNSSFSPTMKAFASRCQSSRQRRCSHPLISSMCWDNLLRTEMTLL